MANDAATTKDRRSLLFQDGSSQKFWRIERAGVANVVVFGRVGTTGQTQTKEFADEEAAQAAFDKLVAEKLKKGYSDDGSPPAAEKSRATVEPTKSVAKAAKSVEESRRSAKPDQPAPRSVSRPQRSIDLSPLDWRRAAFRNLPPLEKPEAKPFDKEVGLARLRKASESKYYWNTDWESLKLPVVMTPEEAKFWLQAMSLRVDYGTKPEAIVAELRKRVSSDEFDLDAFLKAEGRYYRPSPPPHAAIPLSNLYPLETLVDALITKDQAARTQSSSHQQPFGVAAGLVSHVFPYADFETRDSLRALIRRRWNLPSTTTGFHLPCECLAAAALGMHDEVMQVANLWPDGHFAGNTYYMQFQSAHDLLFGLSTPDDVAMHWRRLGVLALTPEHVRWFLACTEYSALDCIRDSILAKTSKDEAKALLKAFALVHAPEAAPFMLECKLSSKAPSAAGEWLEENLAHAVEGLIPVAAGRGKLAEAAVEFLRGVKRQGHAELVEQLLAEHSNAEAVAKVRSEVLEHVAKTYPPLDDESTPAWLKSALDVTGPVKMKPLPSWADPSALPPLVVGDRQLNESQMRTLLSILSGAKLPERPPLVAAVREHVDASVRDAFAWKLFEAWQSDGSESKHKWAMGAVGQIGGDACVLQLTPLVRNWPGESQHQRAVFGLECLRAVGTDAALMALNGVAQKLKFKGLKQKAHEFVEEIAAARGMSRAELEDRIVPDCGLDEKGNREFSFGERKFTFVLGPELKPMIKGADGKLRPDLPKPTAKDDAIAAERSTNEWKLLKKQIKEVAQVNAGRLERAMITDRRWKVADFEVLLVRHPLLTHLVRKLLWVAYDAAEKPILDFRVTEEQDYADANDAAASLANAETIGLLHPINTSDDKLAKWGETLSDYEIIAPFPQLGRPIYRLDPAEGGEKTLREFKGVKLDAPTLVYALEGLGWMRGLAMDGGSFNEHSKQFPMSNVTAVVTYDGNVGMGWIDASETLTIADCYFIAGLRKPTWYTEDAKDAKRLCELSPLVLSEVLADLHRIKAKAK